MQPQVVTLAYWLAMSAWFGGALLLTLALPAAFAAVREADPTLPSAVNVELEGQHVALLSSRLHEAIAGAFAPVQWLCAAGVGFAVVAQWVVLARFGFEANAVIGAAVRSALLLATTTLLAYDQRAAGPRAAAAREAVAGAVRDTAAAEAAAGDLEARRRERVTVLQAQLVVLLGLVAFGTVGV